GSPVFHSLGEFLWDASLGNVVESRWDQARRKKDILEFRTPSTGWEGVPHQRDTEGSPRTLGTTEKAEFDNWFDRISSIYSSYDPATFYQAASLGVVPHVLRVLWFHLRRA